MMKNIKVILDLLNIPMFILLFGLSLGTGDLYVIMFMFISLVNIVWSSINDICDE